MCIAILNKTNEISESVLRTCFKNNGDGAGMAWIEHGTIKSFKTMNDISKFVSVYKQARNSTELPIILHFRIATHGSTDINNVHPFHIAQDMVMCHNGIVDIDETIKGKSDTFHLSVYFSKLATYRNLVDYNSLEFSVAETICGTYSKLIFLDSDGNYAITNESLGHWSKDSDTWYSNYTYQDKGLIDVGGKSVKKYGTVQKYGSYNDHGYSYGYGSYKSDWYDDEPYFKPQATEQATNKACSVDIDAYDENMELVEMFCEDYGIDIEDINTDGVDFNDYQAWDITNWYVFDGLLTYFEPSEAENENI